MNRKNQAGSACCASSFCGSICFTARDCNNAAVAGASVQLSQSGVAVGSPVMTNSLGVACVSIPSAGSYDYAISVTGRPTITGTIAATCTTNNLTVYFFPNGTVYLTDPYGTTAMTKGGGCSWTLTRTDPDAPSCPGFTGGSGTINYTLTLTSSGWELDVRYTFCGDFPTTIGWAATSFPGCGRGVAWSLGTLPLSRSLSWPSDFTIFSCTPGIIDPPLGTITVTGT